MYNEYLNFVESNFYKCFLEKNYSIESSVKITSQIDPSVTFVGSSTSPMKKRILNKSIGNTGVIILQNSLRTRGLKTLQASDYSMFGSYFISMGAYVECTNLDKLVLHTFDYLTNYIRIPTEDIIIRINSSDKDLMDSIQQVDNRIFREYNAFEKSYYRHKYGLDDYNVRGRNFNIGVRKKNTNLFLDIGNVIVIENKSKCLAVELALGNCTISMSHFGTDSTVASSRMGDILKINSIEKMKFADCIIVCSILIYENVKRLQSPRWPVYLFKKYCRALDFWKNKLQIDDKIIMEYIRQFLLLEYNTELLMSDQDISNYIKV